LPVQPGNACRIIGVCLALLVLTSQVLAHSTISRHHQAPRATHHAAPRHSDSTPVPVAQIDTDATQQTNEDAQASGDVTVSTDTLATDDQTTPITHSARAALAKRQQAAARLRRGEEIAATAMRFRGTPYRRGGLTSRGMDCSGLVVRSLLLHGINNQPHNAAALYHRGTPVTYHHLQSGDLVFFDCHGRGISHVGIYVGNNRFVHSASYEGVRVDSLTGYYADRLVGARRIR